MVKATSWIPLITHVYACVQALIIYHMKNYNTITILLIFTHKISSSLSKVRIGILYTFIQKFQWINPGKIYGFLKSMNWVNDSYELELALVV